MSESGLGLCVIQWQARIEARSLPQQYQTSLQIGLIERVHVDPFGHVAQIADVSRDRIVDVIVGRLILYFKPSA